MRERLYVVHGAGRDAVGLVQQLTRPIAEVRGNVVDLRQDVVHGLFTVVMVVDLAESDLRAEQFRGLVARIAEDANLTLEVQKYTPVPRSPDRKSLLIVLVGRDRPGIVSRISQQLSGYHVNIEFSRMVARAGVFLMELHADVTQAALPLPNLLGVLREEMSAVGIRSMFQAEDVFNKKKRAVCFDIGTASTSRPTHSSKSLTRRESICEAGIKTSTPISTSNPERTARVTTPETGVLSLNACSRSVHARFARASVCESSIRPVSSSRPSIKTSISSPTQMLISPLESKNSLISTIPSGPRHR